MKMTLSERERAAYLAGDTEKADLLALAEDFDKLMDDYANYNEDIPTVEEWNKLTAECEELRCKVDALEQDLQRALDEIAALEADNENLEAELRIVRP